MRVRVTKDGTKVYGARRAVGDIVDVPDRDGRTLTLLGYAELAAEPAPVRKVAETRALAAEEPPAVEVIESQPDPAAEVGAAPPRGRYRNRQLKSED